MKVTVKLVEIYEVTCNGQALGRYEYVQLGAGLAELRHPCNGRLVIDALPVGDAEEPCDTEVFKASPMLALELLEAMRPGAPQS